jgi:UDP:flavonoid glycosyltransferase YjiC (YdhE family)
MCSETPVVVLPLFAEQAHNAHTAITSGFGRILNKFTLTAGDLHKAIIEVVEDPSYQVQSKKVKRILLDKPISALDEALFYTEQTIRRKQTTFKVMDLSWLMYLHGEVALLVVLIILFIK